MYLNSRNCCCYANGTITMLMLIFSHVSHPPEMSNIQIGRNFNGNSDPLHLVIIIVFNQWRGERSWRMTTVDQLRSETQRLSGRPASRKSGLPLNGNWWIIVQNGFSLVYDMCALMYVAQFPMIASQQALWLIIEVLETIIMFDSMEDMWISIICVMTGHHTVCAIANMNRVLHSRDPLR